MRTVIPERKRAWMPVPFAATLVASALLICSCGPSLRATNGYKFTTADKKPFQVEFIAPEKLSYDKCMREHGLLKTGFGRPDLEEFEAPGGIVRVVSFGDTRPAFDAVSVQCVARDQATVDASRLQGMVNERQVNTGGQNAAIILGGPIAMIGQKVYYEWDSLFGLPVDCTAPTEVLVTHAKGLIAKDGSSVDRVVKYRVTRTQPLAESRVVTDANCAVSKECKLDAQCRAACGRCVR